VEDDPADPERGASRSPGTYFSRVEALQLRVSEAARALHERGVRPTVARIRAALGGGSPNDLAPALKDWRESVVPGLYAGGSGNRDATAPLAFPPMIADLAHELWQRATAAAIVELKGGPKARYVVARTEEAQALRNQVTALRDQSQRDALAYGELRAQSARHEAIARDVLSRVREAETRERDFLRSLGAANQRIAELEATIDQLRAPVAERQPTSTRWHLKKGVRAAARRSKQRPVKARSRAATPKRARPSPKPRTRPPSRRRRKARRR
jgi:hypothetical protein